VLVVLQVAAAATTIGSFVTAHHIHVLGITQERVFGAVDWLYGTCVYLVFVAVICDLGTHYSSFDVLVVFELFQVLMLMLFSLFLLFMRVKDAVEMELRALRPLGELRKLAS